MIRCQSGFSLIEVLVAFSITAVALGILFQIYANGTTASILAENYTEALVIAESKLAGVSVFQAHDDLEMQGRELEKYDWEIRVQDYMDDAQDGDLSPLYALVSVEVDVSWHSRGKLRRVELRTLKPVINR